MGGYKFGPPCNHAASRWAYRISSHSDAEVDEAGGWANISGAIGSVWVCAKPECVERGKQYIAATTLREPRVNESARPRTAS